MTTPRCRSLPGTFRNIKFALPPLLVGMAISACVAQSSSSEDNPSGEDAVASPGSTGDASADAVVNNPNPGPNPGDNQEGKTAFFGVVPTESFRIADDEWSNDQDMGIQSLRIHLEYGENWEDYDKVVNQANSLGMKVMMLVSYGSYPSADRMCPSPWDSQTMVYCYSYDEAKGLLDVLKDAVPHFSALGVKSWEIWNEENGTWNVPAGDYAKLIGEIYEKFKYTDKWDPEATIVFGGIDAVNVGEQGGINGGAKQYVTDFYQSAEYKTFKSKYGRSPFDAVGVHPYNTVAVDRNLVLQYNYFESSVRGVALDEMKNNGDGNLPIWITELGSNQEDDDVQAAELRAFVQSAYAMPEVQRFYYFQYVYPGENWGLVKEDRTPRKSLFEYRDIIAGHRSGQPTTL